MHKIYLYGLFHVGKILNILAIFPEILNILPFLG